MKLTITEPTDFSKKAIKILSEKFEVIQLNEISQLKIHIRSTDILFIRLGLVFSNDLLQKAENLKYICTPTTGLDHIDLSYCTKNNIQVISLKNERQFLDSIPSTAEHAWTLLMSSNRKLYQACQSVSAKTWKRDLFKSFNLKGKILGILGLGRVGSQMTNFAKTFGMQIMGYDTNQEIQLEDVNTVTSAEELFKSSDFVSIHIPLNDNNFKFVNRNLINLMKPEACIINTSRGKVWDEEAVANALREQKIRGVATDVIYGELSDDFKNSPLLSIDQDKYNCIITPHIAGATYDSMQMTEEFIANKLVAHVK